MSYSFSQNRCSELKTEQQKAQNWKDRIRAKETELERNRKQEEHMGEQLEQLKSLLSDEKTALVHTEKQVKESKEKLEKVRFVLLFIFKI